MSVLEKVSKTYYERFGTAPRHVVRAPGRVNLLGEHVDYNDGFVLPVAIDRATFVAFAPSSIKDQTTLIAADFDQQAVFTPQMLNAKTDSQGKSLLAWARYPAGVMWALNEASLETPAMQAVFASDVPRGSGLSSSASVEMAFALAWQTLGGWTRAPMERAELGQKAEIHYVGVNCGIMDQFASACGEKDKALFLDCRSLEYKTVPLPNEVALVIADTTIRRSLTNSAYNQRHAECQEAVRLLQTRLPNVRSLRDVTPADFHKHRNILPENVARRAQHIVEEINRTEQAVFLLKQGNVKAFGRLMNECHVSLRDLYEVSCPELDVMVRVAQSLDGCYGARLTGAGFGGCTVNLVARMQTSAFASALAVGYESETGHPPEIYICTASDGARLVP